MRLKSQEEQNIKLNRSGMRSYILKTSNSGSIKETGDLRQKETLKR